MGLKVFKTVGSADEEFIQLTYNSLDDVYVLETQATGSGAHKDIEIRTEGNLILTIKADGSLSILPGADNTITLGSPSLRFKDINTVLINGV